MSKIHTTRPFKKTYTEMLEEAETWQEVMTLKPTRFVSLTYAPGWLDWFLDEDVVSGYGVFDPYADEQTDEGYETLLDVMEQVLSKTELEVFLLRAEQNLSFALIGLELDTSKQAAHATFKRAQRKLQAALSVDDE